MTKFPIWWQKNRNIIVTMANFFLVPAKWKKVLNQLIATFDALLLPDPAAYSRSIAGGEATRLCDIDIEI
jgi:hypothetical protein